MKFISSVISAMALSLGSGALAQEGGLAGAFSGEFAEVDGCHVLTIAEDSIELSRSEAPECAPVTTVSGRYVFDRFDAAGLSIRGSFKRISSGSNVLNLGARPRFSAGTTMLATVYTVRYRLPNGRIATAQFSNESARQ